MAHKGEKSNGSHYSSSGATKNVYSKKKRTSFVNENDWWAKLSEGFKNIKRGGSYSPQKMVRRMEFREGLSKPKAENKVFSKAELSGNTMTMGDSRQSHFADAMQDPWNYNRKKQKSDNASGY